MKRALIFLTIMIMLTACVGGPKTVVGIQKIKTSSSFDPSTINRVAIVDFNTNVRMKYNPSIIADKFTVELVSSEIFSVIDRNDIKKIMYEVGFQNKSSSAGVLNDATLQKLSAMGADSILTGTLVSLKQSERKGLILFSEAHLTAKLLKIESGEVIWSAEIQKRSKSDKGQDAEPAEVLLADIIEEMCIPLNSESKVKGLMKKLF